MKVQKSSKPCRFGDLEIISAMAITGFLPAFLSVAVQYAIVFYLLFCRRTRKIVFSSKTVLWLIPLTPVAIIPAFFYENYLGAVVGVGLVLLLYFAVYLTKVITVEIFERVTDICCAGSVFAALVAIAERIVYVINPSLDEFKDMRCAGVFFNPNLFGTAVVFVILICIYKLISGRGNKPTLIFFICVNLVSMALCGSLLGIAELVIGVLFIFIFNRNKIAVGIFSAVSAAGIGAVCFYPNLLPRIFEASNSFNLRYRVWQLSVMLFKETPVFGRGFLAYMVESPKYVNADLGFKVWVTTCAHSLLLDSLLCLGIVGTVCVIGFAAGLYIPVFKAWVKKCDRAVTALALSATVGVLAHGIFDETITWPAVAVMFFFILAGSAAYLKEKAE